MTKTWEKLRDADARQGLEPDHHWYRDLPARVSISRGCTKRLLFGQRRGHG